MLRALEQKEKSSGSSLAPEDFTQDKDAILREMKSSGEDFTQDKDAILREMLSLEKDANRIASELDKN